MQIRYNSLTNFPGIDSIVKEEDLSHAERKLLAKCNGLEVVEFGNSVPEESKDSNTIRSSIIRYLLLGGGDKFQTNVVGVHLQGAWIKGELDLRLIQTPLALQLWCCKIEEQPVLLDAQIYGLSLASSHFPGLLASRLKTRGPIYLYDSKSSGLIDLKGAQIGAEFDFSNGQVLANDRSSLRLDEAQIAGSLKLCDGFKSKGTVLLNKSKIRGGLILSSGEFDGAGSNAIEADGVSVDGVVALRGDFCSYGCVNFRGANMKDQLVCIDGVFHPAAGQEDALVLYEAYIGSSVYLSGRFRAVGEVTLQSATIRGSLYCEGGSFEHSKTALNLFSASITGSVFFRNYSDDLACKFNGDVICTEAKIMKNFLVHGVHLDGRFIAPLMEVKRRFSWLNITGKKLSISLAQAKIGILRDNWTSWGLEYSDPPALYLCGFVYDNVFEEDMTINRRIDWLNSNQSTDTLDGLNDNVDGPDSQGSNFDSQPYTQLAKVFDAQGNTKNATRIRIEREHQSRLRNRIRSRQLDGTLSKGFASLVSDIKRPWDWIFRLAFGYGHAPMRALVFLIAIWFSGWVCYGNAYKTFQMAPNSDVVLTSPEWISSIEVYQNCNSNCFPPLQAWLQTAPAEDYEEFSASVYALDLLVPIDTLGQVNAWAPSKNRGIWGWLGYWLRMPIQMIGWIFTAVGAAALAKIIGRRDIR